MSVITLVSPVASIVRPMIGFGLIATLMMIFKPLLVGMLRATLHVMNPRAKSTASLDKERTRNTILLHRMARNFDCSQPNLAAELRSMSLRD